MTAPPLADWPVFLRLWLLQKQLEAFGAPFARGTAQHRWERLLVNVIAGRQWNGRILPRATDAADCWPVAMDEARKWEASGSPPLFV